MATTTFSAKNAATTTYSAKNAATTTFAVTHIVAEDAITQTLPAITQSAVGLAGMIGTAAQSLPSITQASAGNEVFSAAMDHNRLRVRLDPATTSPAPLRSVKS